MMGRQRGDQSQLFHLFNLERRIPACHLLRRINSEVTRVVADLHEKLAPFYSDVGRPSIDPELMIRMLALLTNGPTFPLSTAAQISDVASSIAAPSATSNPCSLNCVTEDRSGTPAYIAAATLSPQRL
jgi:hypothetical protein